MSVRTADERFGHPIHSAPAGSSAPELGATLDEEQDHVEWAAGAVADGDAVR
jgi:hypothetical protein